MRVVVSAACAALVGVVAVGASHAAAAAPACSSAAARSAIAHAKPILALLSNDKVVITPDQADRVLCFDITRDARVDMVVSVGSGGTAGDVGWLVFVATDDRSRLAGSGTGYKLGLLRSGNELEVVQPVYRSKDPNCCPTGGFDRALYRWNGSRLVVARTWHTKRFR